MSGKELRRVEVMGRVKAATVKLVEAAELLEISYRQTKGYGSGIEKEAGKPYNTGAAGGDRIELSQRSCAGKYYSECRNGMEILERR